jgi:hypothetical protein
VRSQQRKQIALGLIGNHLDDVGQVLTLGGELDHGGLGEVADFDPLGKIAARGVAAQRPCGAAGPRPEHRHADIT